MEDSSKPVITINELVAKYGDRTILSNITTYKTSPKKG